MKPQNQERVRYVTINVDVQKDFCPGGALAVENGDQVVSPLNHVNEFTRAHNGDVIFSGDQHPDATPHFADYGGLWPVHCVAGTEGASFHPDLAIDFDTDIIIDKGTGQTDGYSAFEGQTKDNRTLAEIITPGPRERVKVLIGGLATDYCVLNTVLDALELKRQLSRTQQAKLAVYAIVDAMRAVNLQETDGEDALLKMKEAGAILISTEEILSGRVIF